MPKSADTETLVLLDAHAILHRAYHALPDFSSPTGEPTGALYGVTTMLLKIIEELKPTYLIACYDLPEPTYRHEVFDAYKAGRKKTDEALVKQIDRSRDIIDAFGVPIFEKAGFEADDMLGTIAHLTKKNKKLKVIIASGDMDTLQCVDKKRVQVYTLKKGIKDTILYDEKAVKERFGFGPNLVPDYKGLRGDPSDNIPGIAGIGEKTATILLTQFGSLEEIYKKLKKDEQSFLDAGLTPRMVNLLKEGKEEAEFSKMLATIRTDAIDEFSPAGSNWKKNADGEKILSLFSELGFRAITERVKRIFELTEEEATVSSKGVPARDIKEASILLWLLASERTNATYEDVMEYGKSFLHTNSWEETFTELKKQVAKEGLQDIFVKIEKPLIGVIEKMQEIGIKLDTKYLQTLSKKLHKELSSLEKNIYKHATVEFNINSPKQLGEVLFDTLELKPKNAKKTSTGQRSTKESELEKLRDEHPIIPEVLRYRELQKLVSTYIDALPKEVADDGRVHSTLLQTGAATGRMASKDPNLQNIPIRTEEGRLVRGAFVAEKGFELVAIDYSQIELRIAAIMSEDPALIEIFQKGEDVHTGVAMRVFGVKEGEVTGNMRRKAKVINFGILYGMGVNALRQNLGGDTSRQEAQEFLNAYFNTFTKLAEYLEETKTIARNQGYTETMFGRRRHFPGITSSVPFIRAQAERMAINAPIQGTAADCMRVAMRDIGKWIEAEKLNKKVRMLVQVHDELIFEIQKKYLDTAIKKIVNLMQSALKGKESHGVPLVAETKVGQNWHDMKPYNI